MAPATRPALLLLIALGVASGVAALVVAVGMAWLVTSVATGSAVTMPIALVASALLIRGILAAIGESAARQAGLACASAVRSAVLSRWLCLPVESRPGGQEATTLAGEGVEALETYVARYVPALVTAAIVPALALGILAVVDIWSALVVLFTLPLLPLFAALIGMHTRDQTRHRMATMTQLAGHFMDVVKGLPTLVAYGRAEHQSTVVRDVGDRHRRATVRTLRTAFLSTAALELLATISVAMVAVGVGLRLAYGTIDLQVGLTAILLAPEAYWPIRRVGTEFHNAAHGAEVLDDLSTELIAPPAGRYPTPSVDPDEVSGDPEDIIDGGAKSAEDQTTLGVRGVSYGYLGNADVLHKITRTTPSRPGLTVLTGPSGCGKSTVLELLAGLRTPRVGVVTCPQAHLAAQRPLLISGTVWENFALTRGATREKAEATLRAVSLWEIVYPRGGLEAVIGDDGFGLSAGQRGRMALARAMLSDTAVLLMDEPTAHIAEDSAPRIRALIADLARQRPVIVATHDPALITLADHRWELRPAERARTPEAPMAVVQTQQPATDSRVAPAGATAQDPSPALWTAISPQNRLRLACALGGASVASGVALTAISGWLIVQASSQPVVLTLLVAIVGVRTFGLARPLLRYAERVVSHDVALDDLARRRADLFDSLVPLTPARLGRGSRATFLTAVVRDLDDVVDEQVRVRVPWAATVIASAVAIGVLAFALPWAAVVVAVGAAAALGIGEIASRWEQSRHDAAVHQRGAVLAATTTVAMHIDAIQAVGGWLRAALHAGVEDGQSTDTERASAREAQILVDLDKRQADYAHAETRLIRVRCYAIAATWAVVAVVTAAVAVLAATAFATGQLSAPWAALVALTPMALAESWTALPEISGAKARARAAQDRLDQVVCQRPAVASRSSTSLNDPATPLEIDSLSARWAARLDEPEHLDLKGLTLPTLASADRLQLTGPNGVGKSTALAVVARQLDPASGCYRVAGRDTQLLSTDSVQSRIAVVDDEPHAFAGTVRANLALAAPGAREEQMLQALHAVDLSTWLATLSDGLDTVVLGLSGGERARLSMARAVLSRRPIVLMDEPTAHLDDATAARAVAGVCRSRPLDGAANHRHHEPTGPTVVAVSHQLHSWPGFATVQMEA